ncbi:YbfB/YjiJ family MFS transporter [Rickettsiales bacterium]|nr:YbfB/YjiJ family MFS transporter [Rickettsiales bacterium]
MNDIKLVFLGICSTAVAIGFSRFCYTPILPEMQNNLNFNSASLGMIASWNYFGYFIGSIIPIFFKSDQKIKIILIYSLLFSVITTFLMGMNVNLSWFSLIRFFSGVSSALIFVLATVIIFGQISLKNKKNLQLMHFCGIGVGIFFGTLVIWIASLYNLHWKISWFLISLVSLIFCLPIIFFLKKIKKITKNNEYFVDDPSIISFVLISFGYFFFGIGYIIYGTFISALVREVQVHENFHFIAWLIVGISSFFSILVWKRFLSKLSYDLSLFIACCTSGVGVVFSLLEGNYFFLIISCFLYGLGVPSAVALVLLEGKKRYKGEIRVALAILTTAFSIGQIIGPYCAGILIDMQNNYSYSMLLSMFCLFISGLLMINPKRYKYKKI